MDDCRVKVIKRNVKGGYEEGGETIKWYGDNSISLAVL